MKIVLGKTTLDIGNITTQQQKIFFDIINAADIYKKVYPKNYEFLEKNLYYFR